MSTATGDAQGALRPYVITRGRARAAYGRLGLSTLLTALEAAPRREARETREERLLLRICARPTAFAEAAARLGLPVGLVRVLASDLIGRGELAVREEESGTPETRLLQQVLSGLRRL